MEDFDFYADEEEEAEEAEAEGSNRTFLIIVAALGIPMILGVCAIIIWAVFGQRWMANQIQNENAAVETMNAQNVANATAAIETAQAVPTATDTPEPTDTPQPTSTEAPTNTPEPSSPTATPAESATGGTSEAGTEATPKPTSRPTATAKPGSDSGTNDVPDTGIGVLGAGGLALGLLFLLFIVRRLRRTA